jgi:hypothetical protein
LPGLLRDISRDKEASSWCLLMQACDQGDAPYRCVLDSLLMSDGNTNKSILLTGQFVIHKCTHTIYVYIYIYIYIYIHNLIKSFRIFQKNTLLWQY